MKRWLRRIVIAAALIAVVAGVLFECATRVGRGWLFGEPFYEGRPASYWASEIERWETQAPAWKMLRNYERRPALPRWVERMFHDSRWPSLLDGDPDGLAVLQALRKHPSSEVQDWARIGVERIDNGERGPSKINHPAVIVTAQLYEVDEEFYKEVAKAKFRSTADLEEMERAFLDRVERPEQPPDAESLFDRLGKQKLLLADQKIKLEYGQEGLLISLTKEINCLPRPDQLRKGQKGPQTIDVGMCLRVQAQISRDRRFVRMKFIEKDSQLDGIEKTQVLVDNDGTEAVAEIPYLRVSTLSTMRNVPDGGSWLLPLQYRPDSAKEKDRWFVARVSLRIHIEEEERAIRAQGAK
jgi:hypothetical protein